MLGWGDNIAERAAKVRTSNQVCLVVLKGELVGVVHLSLRYLHTDVVEYVCVTLSVVTHRLGVRVHLMARFCVTYHTNITRGWLVCFPVTPCLTSAHLFLNPLDPCLSALHSMVFGVLTIGAL